MYDEPKKQQELKKEVMKIQEFASQDQFNVWKTEQKMDIRNTRNKNVTS
ncbi:MAG: hypothetical protein FWG55_07390 [Candidatus Bathyarchaeota archaeon]|nr:hypothetical protein [Candidatus Termiticorpusculum sp.]